MPSSCYQPPSIAIFWPVIMSDAVAQRNSTRSATCSGCIRSLTDCRSSPPKPIASKRVERPVINTFFPSILTADGRYRTSEGAVRVTRLVDMQRDRHLASGDLRGESAPLSHSSRTSLLVDLPRDEMALLIELVVRLGMN